MHKWLFSILISIAITTNVFGQKIIKNEVDKFTKVHVIETSKEVLKSQFKRMLRQSFISYNGEVYLELTMTYHSAFSVSEGSTVYLLLENDKSIPIKCTRGGTSDYNSDYLSNTTFWYGTFSYLIPDSIISDLLNKKIIAVRVGLNSNEYDVWNDVKPKNAIKFQKMLQMVDKKDIVKN